MHNKMFQDSFFNYEFENTSLFAYRRIFHNGEKSVYNHGGGQFSCDLYPCWFLLAATVCCANYNEQNHKHRHKLNSDKMNDDKHWTHGQYKDNESITNKIKGTNFTLKLFIRSLKVSFQLVCSSLNFHNRGGEPTPTFTPSLKRKLHSNFP